MKKHILSLVLAFAGTFAFGQVDLAQMIQAPGGAYIVFTDDGTDYPIPGIQEYHAWKDLHLIDTLQIVGDSALCISLFMDSIPQNCVRIPGIEGICLDTFYVTPGDSLVLVECDGDSTFFAGGGGGPDLNGIFDSANEGDTIEISTAEISSAIGSFTLSALGAANTSYWGYEPFAGGAGMIVYDDQNRSLVTLQSAHGSAGTFIDFYCGANLFNVGGNVGGDFYIQDGTIKPFYIESSATVNNSLKIEADGDLVLADYPNTRDDGTPVNFMGTTIAGVLQSFPVGDLADGDGDPANEIQTLDVSGTGPTVTLDLSSDASDPTITGAGTVAVTATGNAITVTGTADGDGSSTNELQTLATTSDATSNTTTLSNSGGSIKLIEGAGIALNTGVTGLNGEVTIASTVVDTDTDDQGLTITGASSPFTIDIDNGSDVAIASGTNVTLTETPANQLNIAVADEAIQDVAGAMFTGNTETGVTVTYQDTDGTIDVVAADDSATNEAWTIDADDADTELITNQVVTFEGLSGITTNWVPFTNTLEIELTGGGGDGNGMWTASNDNTNIANSAFEVGVPGYLDFRDGSEHDLYIDAANDRIGMGTNGPSYGLHIKNDAGMSLESFSDDTPAILKIESTEEGGTGIDSTMSNMIWAYTDTDYAAGAEQTAVDMGLYKFSDTGQRSVFKMSMNEGTRSDAIVIEKEAALSGNHQETLVSVNGGWANTQNYEWTGTSGNLALDRGYFGVIVSGSGTLGNEVTLPNIFGNGDNWKSTMTSTDCQVGQEYYITNLRAATGLIVRTNSGDFFRASATNINIPFGFTAHIRASRLNGTTGVWAYWLSE